MSLLRCTDASRILLIGSSNRQPLGKKPWRLFQTGAPVQCKVGGREALPVLVLAGYTVPALAAANNIAPRLVLHQPKH